MQIRALPLGLLGKSGQVWVRTQNREEAAHLRGKGLRLCQEVWIHTQNRLFPPIPCPQIEKEVKQG